MRKKQQQALIDQLKLEIDTAEVRINDAYQAGRPEDGQYWVGVIDIARWVISELGGGVYKPAFTPPQIVTPDPIVPIFSPRPLTRREQRMQPPDVQD